MQEIKKNRFKWIGKDFIPEKKVLFIGACKISRTFISGNKERNPMTEAIKIIEWYEKLNHERKISDNNDPIIAPNVSKVLWIPNPKPILFGEDFAIIVSIGVLRRPFPMRSKLAKIKATGHVFENESKNLHIDENIYPEEANIFLCPVLSDQYPTKTLAKFAMLSRMPAINPTMIGLPPRDKINIGKIGRIISVLISLNKLAKPSQRILRLIPPLFLIFLICKLPPLLE